MAIRSAGKLAAGSRGGATVWCTPSKARPTRRAAGRPECPKVEVGGGGGGRGERKQGPRRK
ncbi:hypothetical protein CORC01_01865 [Colletotrichum orchidophilum]|uniref:Uncharacterized protein n=1 Tax=Colletotrichum orchidophilum TaxID=1209926 RepID=A0A1G4BMX9_9PEZI|nr:uncharacterized protein CORC01_01865 [Colletotrichum orchidophilum]OHF02764.1 hypothetical protein CORC01_01865 [Colletotrichum orchidophilum]